MTPFDLTTGLQIAKGIATYIPGRLRRLESTTGGTDAASYCYSVWMRHLVQLHLNGLDGVPRVVAEVGPGSTLGTGLAALLSGTDRYFALDRLAYARPEQDLAIFDTLVEMFAARAPIPGGNDHRPILPSYEFPRRILTGERMERALAPARLAAIREAIARRARSGPVEIAYAAPWCDPAFVPAGGVDLVYSTAALEHVDDLEGLYSLQRLWLHAGGVSCHQIDFRCHGRASAWNGHWAYSDPVWRLITGKHSYLLNRLPHSRHAELLRLNGFRVVLDLCEEDRSGIDRAALAPRFRDLTDADLTTCGALMIAMRD